MKQWAIAIGINQYHNFQPLSYAQQDAQAVQRFLLESAGLSNDRALLLTETSPPFLGDATHPDRATILHWLGLLSQQPLEAGDLLWVFFSGYGVCYEGRDYLVPIDADPSLIRETAIPFETVYQYLKPLSAATVLVMLDMNRSQGMVSNEAVGQQTAQLAAETGIPTLFSCQPQQFSREASSLGHGLFTAALLEGLRQSDRPTLFDLNQFLRLRVSELSEHHQRPDQEPLLACPPEKQPQRLLPGLPVAVSATPQVFKGDRDFFVEDAAPRNGSSTVHFPYRPMTSNRSNDPPRLTPPAHPPTEISDAQFWRPVLLWGGGAVLLLLLGVLAKNWSAITQGAPTIGLSPSPVASSPAPSSPATSNPPVASQPTLVREKSVLEQARAKTVVKSTQSDAYREAIQTASRIKPGQPEYLEAQRTIAGWNQDILDIARQQAQQKQYDLAILSAANMTEHNPVIYREAQIELGRWCKLLSPNLPKDSSQFQAREFCRKRPS